MASATTVYNPLFRELLRARGLTDREAQAVFLTPSYDATNHDPYLLPDMKPAVERLAIAAKRNERVVIYGDYDIDGLTATSILLDAFRSFGLSPTAFIPNRFVEGYGLSMAAIEKLAADGAQLIVTVDCGSLSHKEVARANELGVDVIVTDHHTVAETMPPAIAVINPKRSDHKYPFIDLAGCGVAFKLVQALQKRLPGLPDGQEKWLLDLMALGTVCDVVKLQDENRTKVYFGLKVLAKTRRPGIRALMAVAGVEPDQINARHLGFALGPRLNASGRLETARLSLELLTSTDNMRALALAQQLDDMNKRRRADQDKIFKEAITQAEECSNDRVLVLSHPEWSHGIVGIVAAKILERYKKPTFVMQQMGEQTKGSARSYGDFSAVAAIRASEQWIIKGGGHTLAAGVTLKTSNIDNFRQAMNAHYASLKLGPQAQLLDPQADISIESFQYIDEKLIDDIALLEPYGHGNPEPIFCLQHVEVADVRLMGSDNQHMKLRVLDHAGREIAVIMFNTPADCPKPEPGDMVSMWVNLSVNEWRGRRSVEGRLLKLNLL